MLLPFAVPNLLSFIESADEVSSNLVVKNSKYSTLSVLNRHLNVYPDLGGGIVIGDTSGSDNPFAEIQLCVLLQVVLFQVFHDYLLHFRLLGNGSPLRLEVVTLGAVLVQESIHYSSGYGQELTLWLFKLTYEFACNDWVIIFKLRVDGEVALKEQPFLLLRVLRHGCDNSQTLLLFLWRFVVFLVFLLLVFFFIRFVLFFNILKHVCTFGLLQLLLFFLVMD